jgi:hypothetical protein
MDAEIVVDIDVDDAGSMPMTTPEDCMAVLTPG